MRSRALPVTALLALLTGCPAPGGAEPAATAVLRSPDVTTTSAPTPTPAPPAPTPPPSLSGHVRAPAAVLADALGLAATDGQDRLPLLNSGLLANAGAPRGLLQAADGAIAKALVVLTDPAQKPYLDPTGAPLTATTDATGAYQLDRNLPTGLDVIVTALTSGAQRLTAYLVPGAGTNALDLDLASTLATELLRGEAARAGKAPGKYPYADFRKLVDGTRDALAKGTIPAVVQAVADDGSSRAATPFDLRLDQSQALRNQYAVALSAVKPDDAAIKALSDGWKALTGNRPRAVTSLAGNGRLPVVSAGQVESDGPLGDPTAVAVATRGDVFVACGGAAIDGGSVRWRKGDGTLAAVPMPQALGRPSGVVVEVQPADGVDGSLLVADERSHRIWRMALGNGAMTIIAGDAEPLGAPAPEHPAVVDGPDVFDPTAPATSRWRLADEGQRLYRTTRNPVPNPARFARLAAPGALALDELGNLYVADRGNQRVRMIPKAAGSYYGWRQPFDDKGDGVPGRLGDLTPMQPGCIYTIAGNPAWDPAHTPIQETGHWFGDFGGDAGPGQLAKLDEPAALAYFDGFLYVADRENQRVRRISRASGVIETVAGLPAGPQHATLAQHQGLPTDFEFPVGDGGDGGPGAVARLAYPSGLAIDPARKVLYIADQGNGRIRELVLEGLRLASRAGRPHDAQGAADRVDHDRDGEAEAYVDLLETRGLAVDASGNLLLADGRHRRLRKLWLQWE
ncbi:MAG: serine/threonine protein kinase [Cyanobacteria bacterium RYN_339]|nr:serine/threonine protein kinase [Cyanobacteria bacterium RYN_339]